MAFLVRRHRDLLIISLLATSTVMRTELTLHIVWDRLVKLELHPLAPICDICIVDALHEYCPAVRVVLGRPLWFGIRLGIEEFRCAAEDEWAVDLDVSHAFSSVGRCHFVVSGRGCLVERMAEAGLMILKKFQLPASRNTGAKISSGAALIR
jgi:hypothetical protein